MNCGLGQQIHIGGFRSSMALAEKAGIGPGMTGADRCCCNGAGMRFFTRDRKRGADAWREQNANSAASTWWGLRSVSRGDKTAIEFFLGGIAGWDTGLRRRMDDVKL